MLNLYTYFNFENQKIGWPVVCGYLYFCRSAVWIAGCWQRKLKYFNVVILVIVSILISLLEIDIVYYCRGWQQQYHYYEWLE